MSYTAGLKRQPQAALPCPGVRGNPWLRTLALLALLGLCTLAQPVRAQILIKGDQPNLPIDASMRSRVIDGILKHLGDSYVFPDVAKKMQKAIRGRLKNKEYDKITSGQELAKLLTKHLQEVSRDKHLRVMCSALKLPRRPEGKEADPKQRERFRARMKKLNAGFQKVERLPGNVGYLELRGFLDHEIAAEPAAAAFNFLANADALIIDLRKNGGGNPKTVALVCSYFFDEKPVHLNSLYWRKGNRTEEFWTLKKVAGKRYLDKDVFILTSKRTFSAAEEFTYNLKNLKRATVVGETTGGGAHPGGGFPVGDHFIIFVPTGRAINPITKTNWEGVGVKPDIVVTADKALDTAHKEAIKRLLKKAKDEETKRLIQMDLERAKAEQKNTGS
jgi:hypothetical protein